MNAWAFIIERNENGSLTVADRWTRQALHVLVPGTEWTSPEGVFFQMALDGEFLLKDST